jgi:hypothetical protein
VATPTDAARDRVLAARADLADEFQILEASGRAAVDIPAKIRRSPAKAAAVAGGLGFLALKGPQRLFRVVRGKDKPLPKSMLPEEIEKSLRRLGSDGDRVRGTLERDFAEYAAQKQKSRRGQRNLLVLAVAQPILARAARASAEWLFSPDKGSFERRIAEMRARVDPNYVPPVEDAAEMLAAGEPTAAPVDESPAVGRDAAR